MVRSHRARHRGFTLVEVLVALAIISIALLSALRAAGQGTGNATELRMRLLAGWVAENRLAEHSARSDWLSPGIQRGAAREAGVEFAWREEVSELPSPVFRRIDVFVYQAPESTRALAHLTGFLLYSPKVAR